MDQSGKQTASQPAQSQIQPVQPAQSIQPNKEFGKKVLIVEDEQAMARAMEVKLQKAGINAHAVYGGAEAFVELSKGGYALVLLDIMMPGMDGWEVLSKIKEKGITVKVVITSNLSQDEDKQKAKELGAVDFLVKSDSSLASIADEVKNLL